MTRHDWNKSAYNPRSRYPVYHIGQDKSTPGQRLIGFLIAAVLVLLIVWRWTVVVNKIEAERVASQAVAAQNGAKWIECNRVIKQMTYSQVIEAKLRGDL
jgi:hypothetical protein